VNQLPDSWQKHLALWRESSAEYHPPLTFLDVANFLTMYGLCAMGICLMAGLLTPFAALSAAGFLAMIYFCMPPWHGMPPNPKVEGHYWIVSKNLVELAACLVIATTPSAHWVGLDALLFGARRRRRLARDAQAHEEQPIESGNVPLQESPESVKVKIKTRPGSLGK
jgi:uncharacterized membrane protein YphA (DoxX/SURF4 family)